VDLVPTAPAGFDASSEAVRQRVNRSFVGRDFVDAVVAERTYAHDATVFEKQKEVLDARWVVGYS
jgi:hypothetical protein